MYGPPAMDAKSEALFRKLESVGVRALPAVIADWKKLGAPASSDPENPGLCVLAHEYGNLPDHSAQKGIDKMLETFVEISLDALDKQVKSTPKVPLTWDKVVETFNQNPCMTRVPELTLDVRETFDIPKTTTLAILPRGRSNKDEEIVNDLDTWLEYKLVTDPNILAATKIHVGRVANIVARTGPISYNNIQIRNTTAKKGLNFIDVGVIRYPDFTHPYIQLYRICLNAWSTCKSTAWGFVQENRAGVRGCFSVRTYKPSEELRQTQQSLDDAKRMAVSQLSSS